MRSKRQAEVHSDLDSMWEAHRRYLKRMLIGMTRDIDLADDLLQETYLKACSGITRYRGDGDRAWLTAIAKNAFHSHARRPYVCRETMLREDLPADHRSQNGSTEHLTALDVRGAIEKLSSTLRTALIMRYYGGFAYAEIGEHLSCPTGTARRRVWSAVQKLKAVLSPGEEEMSYMRCRSVRGTALLDYLSDRLDEKQAKRVKAHLDECRACREEAREIEKVIGALSAAEGAYKTTEIIDIDENGAATKYDWRSMVAQEHSMDKFWWTIDKDHSVEYAMLQGEQVTLEVLPASDMQFRYWAPLPWPAEPGESVDTVLVLRTDDPEDHAREIGDGTWRYSYATTPNIPRESVHVLAIRLPPKARVISADPVPGETKTEGTTLIWRNVLSRPDGSPLWHFECSVDYALGSTPQSAREDVKKEECREGPVVRAPEILFKIEDSPVTGAGDTALELFAEAVESDMDYLPAWFTLGIALYEADHYAESLQAFERSERDSKRLHWFGPGSLPPPAWQGHVLDLLGRRAEALECYRRALGATHNRAVIHHRYGIVVDRKWVEERLKTPFERVSYRPSGDG